MTDSSFINPKLSYKNLDRYIIRSSIFNAINENLTLFSGNLLDIGCGKMPYKNYIIKESEVEKYIGLDIDTALIYDKTITPDYTWDGRVMPFEENCFDCAIGTEVLEHCPEPEIVLKEVNRVLKPGSTFFFTVPFLWNLHEVPNDEYRYTPFSLKRHLENSGFVNIEIFASGGWHSSLAQMLGLWVNRGVGNKIAKKVLSFFFKPIISFLIKKDKAPTDFKEGQMIPSFFGIAYKPEF